MTIHQRNIGSFLLPITLLFWGLIAIALFRDFGPYERPDSKHIPLWIWFTVYINPVFFAIYLLSLKSLYRATLSPDRAANWRRKVALISPLPASLVGILILFLIIARTSNT